LDVAWHAPTGKNDRKVRLTVIDNKETLAKFRAEAHAGIDRLAHAGKLPPGMERFADFPKLWATKKIDILFRGAPHLLVTSAPKNSPSPTADCFIAMSYFELYGQTQGVGTVWDGLLKWTMDMLPELQKTLGIPEDHQVGYAMAFGKPAVRFTRTVQHKPAIIHRVSL
jgi:nitroreductase